MVNEEKLENFGIEIIEAKTKAEHKKFVRFPTWLYKGNKCYAHPLDNDELNLFSPKNPSWDEVELKLFLAVKQNAEYGMKYKGGKKIVGRIAVLVQKLYNKKNGVNYARFTRFDLIDDRAVAFALLDAGCEFARNAGMEVIHGPLGFSDLDKEGLLVEGFDRLNTFAEIYNYSYYKTHIEEYGFKKEVDWLEFEIKIPDKLDDRIAKIADRMKERLGLSILPKSMSIKQVLKLYGKRVFEVLNTCYADLHGVIPISEKLSESVLKQFKQIVKREHLCIIFKGEEIVGFGLTAPNISRSLNKAQGRICKFGFLPINGIRIMMEAAKPKYVDLCLIAIIPEYRSKGINAILMNEMFSNLVDNKIVSVETNLQLEHNIGVINMFDGYNKELIKRRRCYSFPLSKE